MFYPDILKYRIDQFNIQTKHQEMTPINELSQQNYCKTEWNTLAFLHIMTRCDSSTVLSSPINSLKEVAMKVEELAEDVSLEYADIFNHSLNAQ